jgi:ketosteroid isomerase-like protein
VVSEEPRTTDSEEALRRVLEAGSTIDMTHLVRDDTAWAAYSAALTPLVAPDVVFDPWELRGIEESTLPDMAGETYRGLEGFRRAIATLTEPFEAMIYEFERIVGSGDRFVSIHRVRAKYRHTGIRFDTQLAYIWSFRDGRIVHIQGAFRDPADAVKVVGLEQ